MISTGKITKLNDYFKGLYKKYIILPIDGDGDSIEEEEKTGWSVSDSWVGSGPR